MPSLVYYIMHSGSSQQRGEPTNDGGAHIALLLKNNDLFSHMRKDDLPRNPRLTHKDIARIGRSI